MVTKKEREKVTNQSKVTVRTILKKTPRATITLKAGPSRGVHFKEEFESEGDILKW